MDLNYDAIIDDPGCRPAGAGVWRRRWPVDARSTRTTTAAHRRAPNQVVGVTRTTRQATSPVLARANSSVPASGPYRDGELLCSFFAEEKKDTTTGSPRRRVRPASRRTHVRTRPAISVSPFAHVGPSPSTRFCFMHVSCLAPGRRGCGCCRNELVLVFEMSLFSAGLDRNGDGLRRPSVCPW